MHTKTEKTNPVGHPVVGESEEALSTDAAPVRRTFVEPKVSFPIDVLDSTTFFQFTESGATN